MDLAELIYPTLVQDFFAQFWETKFLFVSRNRPEHLSSLFSLRDLDYLLGHLPKATKIRIANGRKNRQHHPDYMEAGMRGLGGLYESFYKGNTLIVESLHNHWTPVSRLCQTILMETGMQTQANLYVTPPRGLGFNCHWDGHDALILQLEGKKRWRIYPEASDLPRPDSPGGQYKKKGQRPRQVLMRPGDVLYLPRGVAHEAVAVDEPSMHITLGLMATTWEDLLLAAVRSLGTKTPALRKTLPRGWVSNPETVNSALKGYQALAGELLTGTNVRDALDLLGSELLENTPSIPDGHFTQINLIDRLSLDSVVEKRSGDFLRIASTENGPALLFPGGSQAGPVKLFWALRFIAGEKRIRVGDIPGWYSDEERLLLVKHLVRKGFLRIVSLTSANDNGPPQLPAEATKVVGSER